MPSFDNSRQVFAVDLNVASHTLLYFGNLVTNLVLRPFCTSSLFFSVWLAGWLSACLAVELPVYPALFDILSVQKKWERERKKRKNIVKRCLIFLSFFAFPSPLPFQCCDYAGPCPAVNFQPDAPQNRL